MSEQPNKQLFAQSPLRDIFDAEGGVETRGERLFNSKDPNLAILHEKPEHRLILWMKARGNSNREIAKALGYTEPWVSQILRQPWAKDRLVQMMREAGANELSTILEGAAADSLFTLIELRDESPNPAVRRAAADSLLDRYLGKPTQRVETEQKLSVTGDMTEIDLELAALTAEANRLTGQN